jgi:hypothetical protein
MSRARSLLAASLALASIFHSALGWSTARKLNEEEAQTLAAAATGHDKSPEDLDFQDTMTSPSFFVFYGLNQPMGEGGFGFFAVNRWTGDVWALWGCHRLSTPPLRKSQRQIWRRSTSTEMTHYPHLSHIRPECISEN